MLTVDLDRLGLRRGDWLLDAGCGGGRHCFGALDRGAHSVGLDLDVASLRVARAGIHERRGRASDKLHGGVLRGDVFHLPFPDGAFDRVICSEVMEHVHDYGSAARELARVLRPGGTLGVTIPTAITEWLYLAATRHYFESPGGHIRVFSPRALALALARAGMRVEGVGFAHAFHSPYWLVRALIGLDDERAAPTRAFRAFLLRAAFSRRWSRIERLFDWVWPKSLVLYGTRVASGRLEAPRCA
ncbi:MAG TPA: class I SAM-dependent methyltransferase [Myxococcota bacterium]|nr:class I SAM-dependent methyltransferase [Myxococcota bacterium]